MLKAVNKKIARPIEVWEEKTFSFKVASIDEAQGIIRGYLSVFNNVDSSNDRVRPGAFKKTINDGLERKSNRGKKFLWPLLWMHNPEIPIGGFIDATEDKTGLLVTAQLDITTNEQGIPLNPQAMAIFSGFKMGYIDELSIGYKAIQKLYEPGTGIRDLSELMVREGSAVTMLFASNDLAQVNDVKTSAYRLQRKGASGGDFPLADRKTPWSKSKAIQDIEAVTGGDWSKASKYFFWSAPDPKTEADHKLPFVAQVNGEMRAVPQAIISAAGVLRGAMGGAKGMDDLDSVKAKIAGYYSQMGMTPPWTTTNGEKYMPQPLEVKDFNDYYRMRQIADWADRWSSLTQALRSAVLDAFNVGDSPDQDVSDALNGSDDSPGFINALMDWVNEGIALNVSNYMKQPDVDSLSNSTGALGYMARSDALEVKAGAVVSKDNADRLNGHINTLGLATKAIQTVADDMQRYITGSPPFASDGSGNGTETDENAGTEQKSHRPRFAPVQPPHGTDDSEFIAQAEQFFASQMSNR